MRPETFLSGNCDSRLCPKSIGVLDHATDLSFD
jgi:hypothetical protein